MNMKILLVAVIFLIILGLFTFSPGFNWSMIKHVSVYDAYLLKGDWLNFFRYAIVPSLFALVALAFLFFGTK